MFQITDEFIKLNSDSLAYKRGLEYYSGKKIKAAQYNQAMRVFEAIVSGERNYDVKVSFDMIGKVISASCTCPAYRNYWGYCKHVVAVLHFIKERDSQGFFDNIQYRQVAKQIFSFFESRANIVRIPVELEVTYEFMEHSWGNVSPCSALSLRIGEKKLYVVKSIKKFFESYEKGEEIHFGKDFHFDPFVHSFKPEDKKIIDFLHEIYQNEEMADLLSYDHKRASVFKDKLVYLSDSALCHFFEIMGDRAFKAVILNKEFDKISVVKQDFPINFHLGAMSNNLVLDIRFEGALVPLTEDGEYFFANDTIYKVSETQRENFKPFYLAMKFQKDRKIVFLEEDKERFVSEVLPFAEKAGQLEIDEAVQAMIEKVDLNALIYLERSGKGISASISFNYGERKINPFAAQDTSLKTGEKILLRDVEKERIILNILGETEFIVRNNKLYLEDEEKIFEFVFEKIPKLQEFATFYYSEDFKSVSIKPPSAFYGGLRLSANTDLLEFSFGIEGIDRSELVEVFRSLREKKKYYRLKDGSYLPLDSKELLQIADIIEYLDLSKKDIEKEVIEIPKYRALYLDQRLKQSGSHFIDRNHVFREFVQNVREPEDMDFQIPKELKSTLREYQRFGFKWLKTLAAYGLGGILADDMGLGKTLQVITLILADRNQYGPTPSLIVVPTSLVYNWCAEVEKFAPQLKVVAISGNKSERQKLMEEIKESDIVVTSYPLIRRDIDLYSEISFRYCILDEAQHIKNPNSINAKSVKEIKAERRFALTGTPIENSLTELWSIFDFVMPGYLFSHNRFVRDYEGPIARNGDTKKMEDLSRQIRPFILRRLKTDVLKELPKKIENKMVAELTEEQKKVYLVYLQQIRGEIEKEIEEKGFEKSQIKILSGLTRLRQICCHPSLFLEDFQGESGKMLLLQEVVQDAIDSGHRILLFSQFTSMLDIIRNWLSGEKIDYMYLDGSTPADTRGKLVKSFNSGQGDIFLISLKAGGTGLNLTGADMVIHYDPWWNPAVEDQATDRAYRIGQNKSVQVVKLITKGTIEEKIYALQEKKKELINSVIQPGETLLSKMTQEEIKALFE